MTPMTETLVRTPKSKTGVKDDDVEKVDLMLAWTLGGELLQTLTPELFDGVPKTKISDKKETPNLPDASAMSEDEVLEQLKTLEHLEGNSV